MHINTLALRIGRQGGKVAGEESGIGVARGGDRVPQLLLPPLVRLQILAVLRVHCLPLSSDSIYADEWLNEKLHNTRGITS